MNTRLIGILMILVLGFLQSIAMPAARAALMADLEGPANNQPVSGIGIIRGWAFSDSAGVRISQATLRIDGKDVSAIPCCSVRADVQNAFPQLPAENTRNSGFGITFNYGNLTAGAHTIAVTIQDSSGARFERTHTVTVVKAGDFSFIDQVNLAGASAERQGQDVVITGLRVRDKASQQEKRVNARLRWFQNAQALGLVETSTASAAQTAMPENRLAPLAEKIQPTSAAASIQYAALESPNHGDTGAGIAVVRGWAVAPAGRTIQRVQLFVDGKPAMTIPCCSRRGDVATALPGEPNAANSGFGVTFNYGNLTAGVHSMTVEIEDSSGALRKFVRGILVRNPGDFSFLEQLDLGNAQVRIAGGQLVIESALARDKATGKTAQRNLRFQWNTPAQAFALTEDSIQDVTVSDLTCKVDGDTSNLENLKRNPGPSGISLVEVITATNKAGAQSGRVFVGFEREGAITCSNDIPEINAPIAVNGDINGDGVPDIKIQGDGSAFKVRGNDVTIQQMAFLGFEADFNPIKIIGSNTNVAVLNNQITGGGNGLSTDGLLEIKNLLVGSNYFGKFGSGIRIESSDNSNLNNIIIVDNKIEESNNGVIVVLNKAPNAIISNFNIINNVIKRGKIALSARGVIGDSVIELILISNQIIGLDNGAISLSSDKTILSEIRDNILSSPDCMANRIAISGGGLAQSLVEGNIFSDVCLRGIQIGINNKGAMMTNVQNNQISSQTDSLLGVCIYLYSEFQSQMVAKIINNDINIMGARYTGIRHVSGIRVNGSSSSFTKVEAINNRSFVKKEKGIYSINNGIELDGGFDSDNNVIDALISSNNLDGFYSGIEVNGGYSDKEASRENFVSAEIVGNSANSEKIGSIRGNGIGIFGGNRDPSSNGAVVDNEVKASVTNNITDGIVCKDNIPGNIAKCTLSGNTNISGGAKLTPAGHLTPMSYSAQQQFAAHREEIGVKEQQLRERAATLSDPRLQKRLLDLSDQLYEVQHKMSARMAGVPLSVLSDPME